MTSGRPTILGVSTSMKAHTRSATRGLLDLALAPLQGLCHVDIADLATMPVPLFDGRTPSANRAPAVASALASISAADGLLISVPCYWSGVSGVFKNYIDVLCGPAYDLEDPQTCMRGVPVGLIVVGADEASTVHGGEAADRIVRSVGADLVAAPVGVTNPRSAAIDPNAVGQVKALAALVARAAALRSCGAPS